MSQAELEYDITASPDGGTVWINASDGSCVGRFSKRFGIDVHRSACDQMAGKPECLMCTHVAADQAGWILFVEAMREHHGVDVPVELIPWP